MRLISKAHDLTNATPLFSKLKVLDIYSISSFSVATFMFSYHHNLFPSSQVHHSETRLAYQHRPHFCRTNIKRFSTLYGGPTILEFFASYTNQLLFHIFFKHLKNYPMIAVLALLCFLHPLQSSKPL